MSLNPWQTAVARVYGAGDYAHIQSVEEAKDCGDTLFQFLMIELSTSEGCDTAEEARQRISNALFDLGIVEAAL